MPEDETKSKSLIEMRSDGNNIHEDRVPFTAVDSGNGDSDRLATNCGLEQDGRSAGQRAYLRGRLSRRLPTTFSRFLLVLAILLFILLLIFIGLWAVQKKALANAPCLENHCIVTASEILSHMDNSVSPCDNFYEYACNGWIRSNHIPSGTNTWSLLRKLNTNVDHYTKNLLENSTAAVGDYGLNLAQTYYNSCMNTTDIETRGLTPLFSLLEKYLGGWALLPSGLPGSRRDNDAFLRLGNFDLTDQYLPVVKRLRNTAFFQMHVGQHYKNTSHFLIEITDGALTMQREHYVNDSHPYYVKQKTALREVMKKFVTLLGVKTEDLGKVDEIFAFEREMARRMPDRTERDPEKDYEITTIADVKRKCPVLDWKRLLSELYAPLNYTITDDQTVSLTERDYFFKRCQYVAELLKTENGIRTLHNSIIWSVLWNTIDRLPKIVEHTIEEYRQAESGLEVKTARWMRCVKETLEFFGNPIGRSFVNDHFPEKSKSDATKMIAAIKEAFVEHLTTVSWMEDADKQEAIKKVHAMKSSIGYPENIQDKGEDNRIFGSVVINETTFFENAIVLNEALIQESLRILFDEGRDKWELAPLIVNAFYKETANHIYFPAGILQRPVYDPSYPMSLNYGGIGMVVGHEITHGFDQFGSKRDAHGNLRESWSAKTRATFEKHSQCMIEQYNNYSVLNTSLNGKMTLGENIADNGGIKAAYKAFKKLLGDKLDEPVLPGVSLNSDQLFFLSFARLWCVNNLPEHTLNNVLFDQHTVEPYRVIGTLSNSVEFARVYNCPPGSPMNPVKKCQVW